VVLELEREPDASLRIGQFFPDFERDSSDLGEEVQRDTLEFTFVLEQRSSTLTLEFGRFPLRADLARHAVPFTFDSAAGPDRDSPCFPAAVTGFMGLAA